MQEADVVIVGSGVAGGALTTVLAASNVRVLTLERQVDYRGHVRGEILWPWGVRAARLLGVEQTLLDAGAQVVARFDVYDEGKSEPIRVRVDEAISGIEGSLNIAHPQACSALADAAASAGADVRRGVRDVRLETGKRPSVRWTESDGTTHDSVCKLVVGADGRRTSVRSQARIALEVDQPAHLVAGMLVESSERQTSRSTLGRESRTCSSTPSRKAIGNRASTSASRLTNSLDTPEPRGRRAFWKRASSPASMV